MLDPRAREIYLDHLRPPTGYRLDGAVATTFSLDLLSLLMAPVAMALQDQRIGGQAVPDPVVVLEAIQQAADRFAVFCQKGHIAVPRHDTLLYGYLEPSVVEVQSPDPRGVFHPKTWLLRYSGEDEDAPVRYRFLCLSRNLTFDHSWDTVLTLEGTLAAHRTYGFPLNRPLKDFYRALPGLANGAVPQRIQALVHQMADEVRKVRFEAPEGFEHIERFIPLGIEGHKSFPRFEDHKRALVLSPFLSPQGIERIRQKGQELVLISRADALDGLSDHAFDKLTSTAECFFLDEAAERPEEADLEEGEDRAPRSAQEDFSGLHAKLFLTENGWRATVYTGSANATSAALNGRNVEFVVSLKGYKKRVGIDSFLGDEDNTFAFRNLLRTYRRPEEPTPPTERETLEDLLEEARKAVTEAGLEITIHPNNPEGHTLTLTSGEPALELPEPVGGTCFPITLREHNARDMKPLTQGDGVVFTRVTPEALTSFVGFVLEAKGNQDTARIAFVLNLPVQGLPEGRNQNILRSILSDRDRFIRYLLLILGREGSLGIGSALTGQGKAGKGHPRDLLPLFEELVRAYSRDPEKIRRIGRLVADLKETGNLKEILPKGFEEVWAAFSGTVRGERAT